MLVHLIIVLTLALVPLKAPFDEEAVVIVSPPEYQQEKIEEIIDDVTYSDLPQVKVEQTVLLIQRWLKPPRRCLLRSLKFLIQST